MTRTMTEALLFSPSGFLLRARRGRTGSSCPRGRRRPTGSRWGTCRARRGSLRTKIGRIHKRELMGTSSCVTCLLEVCRPGVHDLHAGGLLEATVILGHGGHGDPDEVLLLVGCELRCERLEGRRVSDRAELRGSRLLAFRRFVMKADQNKRKSYETSDDLLIGAPREGIK